MEHPTAHVTEEDLTYVAQRVESAMETLKKLPLSWPRGPNCAWPDFIRSYWDEYNPESDNATPPRLPPSARAITEMDETIIWLRWLSATEGVRTMRVVMMHGIGVSFSDIAYRFRRRSKGWAHRIYWRGVYVIAHRFIKGQEGKAPAGIKRP